MNAQQWQAEADRLTIAAAFEFDNERCDVLIWAREFALWGALC